MRRQTRTAAETEELGAQVAAGRPAGDAFCSIHLCGDLGAGKTTFARGFLRACGVVGAVRSPTYTLLEVYETPAVSVVHLDLYRLDGPDDLESLGLREWARSGYVWLIEWPERGSGWLPSADLRVALETCNTWHDVGLEAGTALGEMWLTHV